MLSSCGTHGSFRARNGLWTAPPPASCYIEAGAGLTPRPLRRIASGGELSRVMLASKVVLGDADGVDTLVFDEVDAGVGGSVARALASVLADLSVTHQVIVVTHLAQVAVWERALRGLQARRRYSRDHLGSGGGGRSRHRDRAYAFRRCEPGFA